MTSESRMTGRRAARRRYRWGFAAAVAVLGLTAMTSTATASHGNRLRVSTCGLTCGRTCGVFNVNWGSRYPLPKAKPGYRQPDRGYDAGRQAGWAAGFADGKYGRAYRPGPHHAIKAVRGPKRHARHLGRGYLRGFADAYRRGYRQGQRERVWPNWWRH
jgi:hypothetical protein